MLFQCRMPYGFRFRKWRISHTKKLNTNSDYYFPPNDTIR